MRVVVIGAGIAGLVAARTLGDESGGAIEVVVVDKGRSPGGRMATRRIGAATFDHGAQFFTVRTPAFGHRVEDWVDRRLVSVWNHGFAQDDGHPRYIAPGGMTSLAKDLASGSNVQCSTMAFTLRRPSLPTGSPWEVVIDDGTTRPADHVIVTTPLAQAFGLLADSDLALDIEVFRTEYDRTICLLAVLDRPGRVAGSGGEQPTDGVFSFIGDNASKGVSAVPAITFHANPTWSEDHWDDDVGSLGTALTVAAQPWLGDATIIEHQVKKWRFATPRTIAPDPCWTSNDRSVILAGDAFAGPRIEGAHNSGLAAAHAVLS
jgi:renalase